MDTHVYSLQLRVLVSHEDGECVARALEMDLLGSGHTEQAAVEDLKRAVEAQISFAHQKGEPSLINFPAEADYFERWEEAQRKTLRGIVLGDKSLKLEAKAVILSFTPSDLKLLRERRFSPAALACA